MQQRINLRLAAESLLGAHVYVCGLFLIKYLLKLTSEALKAFKTSGHHIDLDLYIYIYIYRYLYNSKDMFLITTI